MIHAYPINDEREHNLGESTTCWCRPQVLFDAPEIRVIHNSADGRELIEKAEEIKAATEKELHP